MIGLLTSSHNRGNDDDDQQNDDTDNQTHSHLHILPPHLLADSVGSSTETLCRDGQVVGLILKSIEALTTLGNLVDVVTHHTHGIINLLPTALVHIQHQRHCSAGVFGVRRGLDTGIVWWQDSQNVTKAHQALAN
jgi:hypothetical protein